MFDKLLATLISQRGFNAGRLREELKRLEEGGYLDPEELQRFAEDPLASLSAAGEGAVDWLKPLLKRAGAGVREALDLPSRSDLEALRKAILEQRADASAATPPEGAEPPPE